MIVKYNESLYKHENNNFSENGTKEIPTFVLDFPERGGVCLKKTGEKPLYEMIQANLVNCDLQNVIESCVHANQYAICNEDNLNTLIADFTGISNLGDLYAGAKRMENTWKELPIEVRESFDSDIKKFIRGIGTDEFNGKVKDGYDKFYGNVKKNKSTDIPKPEASKPEASKPEASKPEVSKPVDKEVTE